MGLFWDKELTFKENIFVDLGWFFCEIAFSCPEWLWCKPVEWSYQLGNYLYNKGYNRILDEDKEDEGGYPSG